MACGLVTRKSKKLSLSSFGHAINDTRLKVETIVEEYSRLKAFDLVMNLKGMEKKEQTDLLDELIKNTDIKSILMEKLNSLAA
jgi:malate/lactate dehydrogenase